MAFRLCELCQEEKALPAGPYCKGCRKRERSALLALEAEDCACQPELHAASTDDVLPAAARARWSRLLAEDEKKRRDDCLRAGDAEGARRHNATLSEAEAGLSPEWRLMAAIFGTMQDAKYLSPCEHVLDAADSFPDEALDARHNGAVLAEWARKLWRAFPCEPGRPLAGRKEDGADEAMCADPPRPVSPHAYVSREARLLEYQARLEAGEAVDDPEDLKDASAVKGLGIQAGKRLRQAGLDVDERRAA
jgi:hypothetical protein